MRFVRESLALFVVLTVLTGVAYPFLVTGVARTLFPRQAEGSFVHRDGRVVGSTLIGQPFADPAYLWSRPSQTSGVAYNASLSGGSNLGPLHPDLAASVAARVVRLRYAYSGNLPIAVPMDLITASGSGLDPHISPAAAEIQVDRIAAARGAPADEIRAVIHAQTQGPDFGFLGEARVNVLLVNLDLDERYGAPRATEP